MQSDHTQSLAHRLSLWTISLGTLIFAIVLITNYYLSRALLDNYIEKLAVAATSSTVEKIESVFIRAEANANSLASIIGISGITDNKVHQSIKALLPNNAKTFGMTVALEPHTLIKTSGNFAPYYFKKGDELIYKNLASEDYDYKKQVWYTAPKEINAPMWSDPYFDEGGGDVQMITYSSPVYIQGSKTFAGIATADVKLKWLDK